MTIAGPSEQVSDAASFGADVSTNGGDGGVGGTAGDAGFQALHRDPLTGDLYVSEAATAIW